MSLRTITNKASKDRFIRTFGCYDVGGFDVRDDGVRGYLCPIGALDNETKETDFAPPEKPKTSHMPQKRV